MKIKSVTIHAGHNKQGKIACGASDYIDESKEARYICRKVIKILKKNGVTAYNCTVNNGTSQSDVLRKIVSKCNSKNRQLDVSIHFNACTHSTKDGKVKGTEVCLYSNEGMKSGVAKKICKNMESIGFTNRGNKARPDLYFLKNTNAPALLIETCFVDDFDDAALYKKSKKLVTKAIAQAIIDFRW